MAGLLFHGNELCHPFSCHSPDLVQLRRSSFAPSVLPPYRESIILPPFSSCPSGMSGDLQGEFFLNDCTKFYVDAGFVGDFEMFTLHTRFSRTFVVMGQLISHNSHYAEYDSAFRDMLSGVWLSLLLLFPYHLGL